MNKLTFKKCEALEGCKKTIRYTVVDHRLNKTLSLCKDHFKQGMKAWLEENRILKHLMQEGII